MRRLVAFCAFAAAAAICVPPASAVQPACATCNAGNGCTKCGQGSLHDRIKSKLHGIPFFVIALPQRAPGGHPQDWINCQCEGTYKHPVPPLYTYHWPGMYSQAAMTDYHSPWRFPPLKPYYDEPSPGEAAHRTVEEYYDEAEPQAPAADDLDEPVYQPRAHRVPLPGDVYRR